MEFVYKHKKVQNKNLQAAVCSYFDFESPLLKLPSMMLIRDEISEEHLNLPPSTNFRKVWTVSNNGDESWPAGCALQFAGGDHLSPCERIPAPALGAKLMTELVTEIVTPSSPGVYQSKWRMVTPKGSYFGDTMWLIITVCEEAMTNELTQQLSHFNALGSPSSQFGDSNRLNNPFGLTNHHYQDSVQQMSTPDGENKMC